VRVPRLAALEHCQLMPRRNALPDQILAGTTICLGSLNGSVAQSIRRASLCPINRNRWLFWLD
jgi:hypothetical protein